MYVWRHIKTHHNIHFRVFYVCKIYLNETVPILKNIPLWVSEVLVVF